MKTTKKKITELTLDPANTRLHPDRNLQAIKASLNKFGQQYPIVVTPKGVVVAGNGRLEAAKALGWKAVDVVVTELEGADLAGFSIADNRTAELAEWDKSALGKTLAALAAEDYDIEASGFSEAALSAVQDQALAEELMDTDDGEQFDPYKLDEERGIDRVPSRLTLTLIVDKDAMEMVDEATTRFQSANEGVTRDLAILGILQEWLDK